MSAQPITPDFQRGQRLPELQATPASLEPLLSEEGQGHGQVELQRSPVQALLTDPTIELFAGIVDDLEEVRKANANRLRMMVRPSAELDKDGENRGWGLDENNPGVIRLTALNKGLEALERQAVRDLEFAMKEHPLHEWITRFKGVGEKSVARLLAVIGDPYINQVTGEPRTVSQLWQYCGHGDPHRKRKKGMSQAELFALGNPEAKMRTYLIAAQIIKTQGELAHEVYYPRRDATADRLHESPCVRCGPSGKPAQPGSPWSLAHQNADAIRILGKHLLKDLWLEARRLHGVTDSPESDSV